MAFTSAKMGLRIWNLLTDLYDHVQLADNWAKVDYHDHSPGKGVQIPTEGLADAAVTGAKLANNIDPSGAYNSYKFVKAGQSVLSAGVTTGIYGLAENYPSATLALGLPSGIWHFDPADYQAAGRSVKLRVKGTALSQNSTAPAVNFAVAMHPVTAVASGAFTIGAAITNSTATLTTPGANSLNVAVGIDFDAPVAGFYILAVTPSGTTAASSSTIIRGQLGVRQV